MKYNLYKNKSIKKWIASFVVFVATIILASAGAVGSFWIMVDSDEALIMASSAGVFIDIALSSWKIVVNLVIVVIVLLIHDVTSVAVMGSFKKEKLKMLNILGI